MTWNNVYLGTPNSSAGSNDQRSASTTAFSDLSVRGAVQATTATITGVTTLSAATLSGVLSLSMTSKTQSVVALTVSANSSADTTFTFTGAKIGDGLVVGAPSAISGDLSFSAWISGADTGKLRLSNCSTVNNVQTAQTWTFYRIGAL